MRNTDPNDTASLIPEEIDSTELDRDPEEEIPEFFAEEILDEDPEFGSPQGVANSEHDHEWIETVADTRKNPEDELENPSEDA